MRPTYFEGSVLMGKIVPPELLELDWERRVDARSEYFMAPLRTEYTYGKGEKARLYISRPMTPLVEEVLRIVNGLIGEAGPLNGCFLNRYDDEHQALGWHADDFQNMDHNKGVAVVSFGQPREIWWRKLGEKGIVPPENRQLLRGGSLFLMPPGFQHTHVHRIPRGDRKMGTRVSLTFRAFVSCPECGQPPIMGSIWGVSLYVGGEEVQRLAERNYRCSAGHLWPIGGPVTVL